MALPEETIADLEDLGFSRWQHGSMDRLYFSPHDMIDPEELPRSDRREVYEDRAYVDVKTGTLRQKGTSSILSYMEDFLAENGYNVVNGRMAEA